MLKSPKLWVTVMKIDDPMKRTMKPTPGTRRR
jgi:hypothetical protein